MLNKDKLYAVGMMAARQARARAKENDVAANEVIDYAALLKEWVTGAYKIGDVVAYQGYPYKCIQAHDSTGNDGWYPSAVPALFAPYHGTDATHALPYVAPTHAGDAYQTGEWMIWTDGVKYKCLQNACVYAPDVLASAWEAETTK